MEELPQVQDLYHKSCSDCKAVYAKKAEQISPEIKRAFEQKTVYYLSLPHKLLQTSIGSCCH